MLDVPLDESPKLSERAPGVTGTEPTGARTTRPGFGSSLEQWRIACVRSGVWGTQIWFIFRSHAANATWLDANRDSWGAGSLTKEEGRFLTLPAS